MRLHAIRIYTQSTDPFYDSVPINLWSMIEVNIGIWCASIPALKALISRSQRERTKAGGAYAYHSRDKSGGKTSGSNGSSQARAMHGDAYGMSFVAGPLQHPKRAARKNSAVDSARSDSDELLYTQKVDDKV